MRINLNLTQKGLILVSVPLVFGLTFFIALCVMLSQAELRATQARQSRELISKVGVLSTHYINAGTAIAAYLFAKPISDQQASIALRKYQEAMSGVPHVFDELHWLTAANARQAAHVANLEGMGRNLTQYFEQCQSNEDRAGINGLLRGNALRQRMQEPFTREVSLMTSELREEEEQFASKEKFWQNWTKWLLYFGIAFNIVITLMLAVFFSRGIANRLGVLTDNAQRLANRKELNQRLTGADEIANLDAVFHQMADSLKEAERQKQEFVSMISHDLRTPLTSLIGTLALVSKGKYGQLNEAGLVRIAKAETSLERLIKLINELLEIERLEAGMVRLQCKKTDVCLVIEQAVDSISAFAEQHGVEIVMPERQDVMIYADQERLVQVLVNLLSNAVKFSNRGGVVRIEVEKDSLGLTVRVIDQGRGVPSQAVATIFDRFKQVKDADAKNNAGTGLGLAISKSIIEAHKGEIGVASELSNGSTFWFKLPADC